MLENFGIAIVQAVGFFGIFGFFVYRLLSEKVSSSSSRVNTNNKNLKPEKKVNAEKKGLFGRKKKVEKIFEIKDKENNKSWFKR
tara:strand:- start:445 stop:696 length:252 start_codon:yes stop_codon:yes gene_type:complete